MKELLRNLKQDENNLETKVQNNQNQNDSLDKHNSEMDFMIQSMENDVYRAK